MFDNIILNVIAFPVLLIACIFAILITGFLCSLIWRLLINISGPLFPLLLASGTLLIFASEMTTPTGISLLIAGFVCFIGFISVGEGEGLGGGTFITIINLTALFLVYDWYSLESVEFLIATIGVFFTFVGEALFSSVD